MVAHTRFPRDAATRLLSFIPCTFTGLHMTRASPPHLTILRSALPFHTVTTHADRGCRTHTRATIPYTHVLQVGTLIRDLRSTYHTPHTYSLLPFRLLHTGLHGCTHSGHSLDSHIYLWFLPFPHTTPPHTRFLYTRDPTVGLHCATCRHLGAAHTITGRLFTLFWTARRAHRTPPYLRVGFPFCIHALPHTIHWFRHRTHRIHTCVRRTRTAYAHARDRFALRLAFCRIFTAHTHTFLAHFPHVAFARTHIQDRFIHGLGHTVTRIPSYLPFFYYTYTTHRCTTPCTFALCRTRAHGCLTHTLRTRTVPRHFTCVAHLHARLGSFHFAHCARCRTRTLSLHQYACTAHLFRAGCLFFAVEQLTLLHLPLTSAHGTHFHSALVLYLRAVCLFILRTICCLPRTHIHACPHWDAHWLSRTPGHCYTRHGLHRTHAHTDLYAHRHLPLPRAHAPRLAPSCSAAVYVCHRRGLGSPISRFARARHTWTRTTWTHRIFTHFCAHTVYCHVDASVLLSHWFTRYLHAHFT